MLTIVGHKNPDTDSIVSAMALSFFIPESRSAKLGEINLETKFVLDFVKMKAPETIENLTGLKVILVDHSERSQTLSSIDHSDLFAIVDHHKIGFTTSKPIIYYALAVGSTATIITKIYRDMSFDIFGSDIRVEMTPEIAVLLFAGLTSDTLDLQSPTTTSMDVQARSYLVKRFGSLLLLSDSFTKSMFEAKSSVAKKTPLEIFNTDSKEFLMGEKKIVISQLETLSPYDIYQKMDAIQDIMHKKNIEEHYDMVIFVVTDLERKGSRVYVFGSRGDFEKSFEVIFKKDENFIWMDGVLSRKSQIVPPLDKFYSKKS